MNVAAYALAPAGDIPNHPRWPLLVYAGALDAETVNLAEAFEALFACNRWPPAWRNGVFSHHHFHSNSHEALGVYSGEVTVLFGGDSGVKLTVKPGDVLVLPAGTGHKKLASSGSLGVVGAYPEGSHPDTCRPAPGNEALALAIARVPLPACDPVSGPGGPLFQHWKY